MFMRNCFVLISKIIKKCDNLNYSIISKMTQKNANLYFLHITVYLPFQNHNIYNIYE